MSNNTKTGEKKKDNTKSMKRMVWATIITFFVICIVCIAGIVLISIFQNDISNIEKGVESTLLATGLSIIGLAIAVWTGLNIVNAITKDDLQDIKSKFEKSKDEIVEQYKNAEKKTTDMQESFQKQFDNTEKEFCKFYTELKKSTFALFLQELFKTEKDICSRYFYYKFSHFNERDIVIDLELWSLLYQIEQKFVEVYNLHQSIYAEDSVLVKKANTGLSLIEELKHKKSIDTNDLFTEAVGDFASENPDNIIKQFLHFRKAEFNFYKGYVKTNNIETAENFLSSAKTYFSFAKIFGCFINLNDIEDIGVDIPIYKGEQPEIAAYLANSIGESYSKMLHLLPTKFDTFKTSYGDIEQNFLEGYAKKAIFYCECAVKWAPKARETYYRNLGCAYERAEKLKGEIGTRKKEVLSNYKTSLSLMIKEKSPALYTQNNVYHVILSYYERIIKQRFIEYDKNILDFEFEKTVEIIKKSPDDTSELIKDLNDYTAIAEMGVLQNCHHTLRVALLGMSYTYVVLLLKSDVSLAKTNFKDAKYYMERLSKIVDMLKLEFDVKDDDNDVIKSEKFDDYSYEVFLRCDALKSV